jgi:hypothetical protein
MAQKLKVFTWSDGFHAFTVATSSKPKALAAWGMGQDIFKSGLAREIHDGAAYEAALKAPGEVIQTGEAVDLGDLKPAAKKAARPDRKAEARKARITALTVELEGLEGTHANALAVIDNKIAELQSQREALQARQETERDVLVAKLRKARAGA